MRTRLKSCPSRASIRARVAASSSAPGPRRASSTMGGTAADVSGAVDRRCTPCIAVRCAPGTTSSDDACGESDARSVRAVVGMRACGIVTRPRAGASAYLHELLQAAQPGRRSLTLVAVAPVGEGHLTHVDIPARVDGQAVWGDELPDLEPGRPIPQARQQLALAAVDAHPRADVGHVVVDG